jgi:hypothetical protein
MMGRMGWIGCNRSDVMDCEALNSGGSDVMERIDGLNGADVTD